MGDGSAAPSKGRLDGGWLGPWIRWAAQPTPRGGVPWTLDLPGPRIVERGGVCFKMTFVSRLENRPHEGVARVTIVPRRAGVLSRAVLRGVEEAAL